MFSFRKIITAAVCCNAAFAFFCGAAFAEAIQITDHASTDNRPAWCPTRNLIAFESDLTGNSELYITSSIGGGTVYRVYMYEPSDPATDTDPTWSPDGTQIAFASDRAGSFDIWIGSGGYVDGPLTAGSEIDTKPSWSPDGSLIAFASNGGAGNEIWVVDSSGGAPTQLTNTGGTYPTWSPDGSHIAYAGPSGDIWIIPSTGGTSVQLTSDPSLDCCPSWSPQGDWIAFMSERSGNSDIWMIPAAGGTSIQMTMDPASDTEPTWSSDGTQLAFTSNRSGNSDIWVTGFFLFGVGADWTYLYVPSNEPAGAANPQPIDLWTLGLVAGDGLRLEQLGAFSNGPAGDTLTRMIGVFSGSDVLLGPTAHPRVQDAIDAGTDFITGNAYWDGGPTDIPEDFWIDDVVVPIPVGANYLFITPYDTGYWDNSDPNGDFAVRITVVHLSGTQQSDFPRASQLKQNVPNPFNPQTTIAFDLPSQTAIRLAVYDVSGRLVDVLIDGEIAAPGRNEVVWRGRDMAGRVVSAGVYFYRLEAGSYSETKRMVLVK